MVTAEYELPARWESLRYHAEQRRLVSSTARFKLIEAGRRSGKTELAKRDEVEAALDADRPDYFGCFMAPTRDQVREIYWEDLKRLSPPWFVSHVSEVRLQVHYKNGATIACIGMDKPARAEGRPIDSAKIDEFADMKPDAWERHIRPALDTPGREGRAWIYGVPRPNTTFKKLAKLAQDPEVEDWDYFWWPSAEILPPDVIEAAKRELDPRTFDQEYGAKRVTVAGRAYYPFESRIHASKSLGWDRSAPLVFAFDFNVDPGSAVVIQEREVEGHGVCTCIIGEVHIPYGSSTPAVCRKLIEEWGEHRGRVECFGDPAGGARHTSQTTGTDWQLIADHLRPHFGDRLLVLRGRKDPGHKARINAVNKRIQTADGAFHLFVDPSCTETIEDFEAVRLLQGGAYEIDKKFDLRRTHWTDAVGYYLHERFPAEERVTVVTQMG